MCINNRILKKNNNPRLKNVWGQDSPQVYLTNATVLQRLEGFAPITPSHPGALPVHPTGDLRDPWTPACSEPPSSHLPGPALSRAVIKELERAAVATS